MNWIMNGMHKKKVLVTGATGYLGSKICLQLRDNGYSVIAVCRNITEEVKCAFKNITLIQADLTASNSYDKLESIPDIDTIIHTVSLDHHQSQKMSILDVNRTNVLPTWELLNRFTQKKIAKFIYLSTIQVLGELPKGNILESTNPNPKNRYALTHLMCENMLNYYNQTSETACINVRLSNGYGAPTFKDNNCWWLFINDLCKMAYYDKKIILKSNGTAERDFIHISDTAKAVELLIEEDFRREMNTFNISSGVTYNLLEVAHIIQKTFASKLNVEIPVYYNTNELSLTTPPTNPSYTINHDKIKSLGYLSTMCIEDGVETLFDYFELIEKKLNEPIS